MQNLSFYFIKQIIIDEKKTRQEKFVLFTSKVQSNKFSECSIIFMDGTFKCCPKSYYPLYNIMGKEKNISLIIPLIFILMSHKSYDIYYYVFKFIKAIIKKQGLKLDLKNTVFMLDFEKSSRKALKDIFSEFNILGCYFEYVKALWSKDKKEGLTKNIFYLMHIY